MTTAELLTLVFGVSGLGLNLVVLAYFYGRLTSKVESLGIALAVHTETERLTTVEIRQNLTLLDQRLYALGKPPYASS